MDIDDIEWSDINYSMMNIRNKLQWNLKQNKDIFIQENAFENIACKMAVILSWPQCLKNKYSIYIHAVCGGYVTRF